MSKFLNAIFGGTAGKIIDSASGLIDGVVTTDQQKLSLKNQLSEIVLDNLGSLQSMQSKVILAESSGSKLQRNWRPLVMLSFAVIVVYAKFIAPAFGLPNAELEPDFWKLLEIGLGGYIIGRSAEKITDRVTANIDMSFLKKKDRK